MTITLSNAVNNTSVQVGDLAYYVSTTSLAGQEVGNDPQLIGVISSIGVSSIVIDNPVNSSTVSPEDFLMFSKDNRVNNSSIKGYYASVTMRHSGPEPAKLFAVSSEVAESSK